MSLPKPTLATRIVGMGELIVVFIAGFVASLVDGALGMGFGPTSSSILLGTGMSPAGVSTTVNLAKVATGITAAIAHWRFENIDRTLVRRIALPGCVGAVLGATILASVDGDQLKPMLSALLILMAVRIVWRFSRPLPTAADRGDDRSGSYDDRGTAAVGLAGGVTNGLVGAWGPVVTPFLLHRGLEPRYAVGSVNTAEVAVAVVASGSLLASVRGGGIDVGIVVAMLAGGVLAAPFAAWVLRFLPARALGVGVGAVLFITNIRELTSGDSLAPWVRWAAYSVAILACTYAALRPRLQRVPAGATS